MNNLCIDCGKIICIRAKRCKKCYGQTMLGKNNPAKRPEISRKISESLTGRKCEWLSQKNKINNPAFSAKNIERMKQCNPAKNPKIRLKLVKNHATANTVTRHHKYLKENSDEIILTTYRKHKMLHARAYDFLYNEYGKTGINNYIKWFDKKYGLDIGKKNEN